MASAAVVAPLCSSLGRTITDFMPDFNKTPRVVTAFFPQLKQVPAQLILV
jgi:hypothetical protein